MAFILGAYTFLESERWPRELLKYLWSDLNDTERERQIDGPC